MLGDIWVQSNICRTTWPVIMHRYQLKTNWRMCTNSTAAWSGPGASFHSVEWTVTTGAPHKHPGSHKHGTDLNKATLNQSLQKKNIYLKRYIHDAFCKCTSINAQSSSQVWNVWFLQSKQQNSHWIQTWHRSTIKCGKKYFFLRPWGSGTRKCPNLI